MIRSAAKRPAPARGRAGAAAKHLGEAVAVPPPRTKWTRRVPDPVLIGHAAGFTPVKPPAARGAAGDAAAAAGGVAVGDTLEVERCSFAVGPVRSPAPPHALTHARTASCVRGRPAQGDCEERTTKP